MGCVVAVKLTYGTLLEVCVDIWYAFVVKITEGTLLEACIYILYIYILYP